MRLIFKDLPLSSHSLARSAHEAARCAGHLGKYWAYHDRLFARQPEFERDQLIAYAVDLGLSRDLFVECLDSHRFADAVEADVVEARKLGVNAAPTFLVNGRPLVGAHPVKTFRATIDEALAARR